LFGIFQNHLTAARLSVVPPAEGDGASNVDQSPHDRFMSDEPFIHKRSYACFLSFVVIESEGRGIKRRDIELGRLITMTPTATAAGTWSGR
jgi:hypothetical protein